MRLVLNILTIILIILYPIGIYFGIKYFSIKEVAVGILIIVLLRLLIKKEKPKKLIASLILLIILSLTAWIFNNPLLLKLYPVSVNLVLFSVFTYSLIIKRPIIEELARLKEKDLPDFAINYTKKVTIAWTIFFLFNALISLFTVFQNMEIWSLYNGLISYILIGILFIVEFIIRYFVKKKNEQI